MKFSGKLMNQQNNCTEREVPRPKQTNAVCSFSSMTPRSKSSDVSILSEASTETKKA